MYYNGKFYIQDYCLYHSERSEESIKNHYSIH